MKPLSWHVEGNSGEYTVTLERGIWLCDCKDFNFRHRKCRHIKAVATLQRLALLDQEAVNILEWLTEQGK